MAGRLALALAVTALLLVAPGVAAAATITPTRFDDPPAGPCLPGDCSLREALLAQTPGEAKTIALKPGAYELQQSLPLQLDQNRDQSTGITIRGAGARATTIDGNNLTQVIHVVDGTGNAMITGVTITGGNGNAGQFVSDGGGILVDGAAALTLDHSAVVGNKASHGGGITAFDTLSVISSTISGNTAETAQGSAGGGIYMGFSPLVTLVNSTVSGNTAHDTNSIDGSLGGGVFINAGTLTTRNVTFARNQAFDGGGIYNSDGSLAMDNTVVADSLKGGACGGLVGKTGGHNLDDDNTCTLSPPLGDKPGVDPQLALLGNRGGPTNTHALAATSPAINSGSGCEKTDQRGVPRPQGGVCDIGAFEYRAPRLTVFKHVVNDNGGTLGAGDFTVHVRTTAGLDAVDSPQPGSETGRTYVRLTPGTYVIGEDADSRYAASLSRGCSATGVITLAEGSVKSCTITNNDKPPVANEEANIAPMAGTVRIKTPGGTWQTLEEGQQIPMGTTVDTRRGRVTLIAASNQSGGTNKAAFYAGIFKLGQTRGARPVTVLTLVEKLRGCKVTKGKATTAAKKKRKRRLWGNGRGRFRTRGRNSAATVVGTWWLVEDRCDSTLTRVRRGKVRVRDFVKKKTVIVRKGHRYIARSN